MTGFTSGMKSSLTDDWATPVSLFKILDDEFHFTLDVCASDTNHKVAKYYDVQKDGLKQDWTKDIAWMNPPYGRQIGDWMKKAYETALGGGDSRMSHPSKNGYPMVERIRHEGIRVEIHQGKGQVRGRYTRRSIPFRYRNIRNTDNTEDKDFRTRSIRREKR